MTNTSQGHIFAILRVLDWNGHVELGDNDLRWLAGELAVALSPPSDQDLCEVCEEIKLIVVRSPLGRICEECLESLAEEASDARESIEDEEGD